MTHWLIAAGVLVACGLAAWLYDRGSQARDRVRRAWADVEAQLVKRHAYVPFLTAVAGQDPGAVEELTEATAKAVAAKASPVADRFAAEERLSKALQRLLALAESSPVLHADRDFRMFREQLEDIEVKLAGGRRSYNAAVQECGSAGDGVFGPTTAPPVPVGSLQP